MTAEATSGSTSTRYFVGKLVARGEVTIKLKGKGSTTGFTFTKPSLAKAGAALFVPGSEAASDAIPSIAWSKRRFDLMCHMNWRDNANNSRYATAAPCDGDDLLIGSAAAGAIKAPDAPPPSIEPGAYVWASSYDRSLYLGKMWAGNGASQREVRATDCDAGGVVQTPNVFLNLGQCAAATTGAATGATTWFGSEGKSKGSALGCASSCPPAAKLPDGGTIQHWYDGTSYKVIGADGAVDDVEVTTTVLPGGGLHFEVDSLAGTVIYTVDGHGEEAVQLTSTVTTVAEAKSTERTTVDPKIKAGDTNGDGKLSAAELEALKAQESAPSAPMTTLPPTPPPKGTPEPKGDDGNTLLVIIVVAVVVVLAVVGVAAYLVVSKRGAQQYSQKHVASFDNPMYDSSTIAAPGEAGSASHYAEPGAASSSGYMDVGPGGGSGYDDATMSFDAGPAGGAEDHGGYMDVMPNDNGDEDPDDEEDL